MKLAIDMVMDILLSLTLLFAGVAVLVVVHICVVRRAFQDVSYTNRQPDFAQGVGLPSRNGKISMEDLQTLPRFEYKLTAAGAVDCTVCLESFHVGDNCRLLPDCGHSFHSHCIDSWLLKTPVCPICRTALSMAVHIELT